MAVFHQLVSSQYFDKRLHVYQVNVTISIQIRFTLKTTRIQQINERLDIQKINRAAAIDISGQTNFNID